MIQPTSLPVRQQGIVLVLYAIGMFAMLIVGGLALDGAHAMLNKNRLQTTWMPPHCRQQRPSTRRPIRRRHRLLRWP
jgi:hypothetical protein